MENHASDGKDSAFTYRCTDPELLTLLPQSAEPAEGRETENPTEPEEEGLIG